MGLAAPQITYIMHALKEKGLNVDVDATTVDEALEILQSDSIILQIPFFTNAGSKSKTGGYAGVLLSLYLYFIHFRDMRWQHYFWQR